MKTRKRSKAITDTRDDIVISFKPHGGYDSPLVAVKAASPQEAADKIKALEAVGLWALIGNADTAFKAAWNLSKGFEGGAEPVANPSASQPSQSRQNSGGSQGYQNRQNGGQGGNQGGDKRRPVDPPAGVTPPTCDHGPKALFPEGKWGPFWACNGRQGDAKGPNCKFEKYQGPPLA